MKISNICEAFALFAKIPQSEAFAFMPLIKVCEKQVRARLREPQLADTCAEELEAYCAARVFYDYLLCQKPDSNKSEKSSSSSTLKVGGLTISEAENHDTAADLQSVQSAELLCQKYEKAVLPLFNDEGFSFRSTE